MLSEMIDTIAELSEGKEHLRLLYEADRVRVYDHKGTIVIDQKPYPARKHSLATLEGLVDATRDLTAAQSDASIWVSECRVVVVLNDSQNSHRDDVLTMSLSVSPFFSTLAKAEKLEQKKMIDLLRHDLCGATIDPQNTLALLRNLKFTINSEQTGNFTAAGAAMGKSVLAEVTGETALPETVRVEFAPYPALRDVIDCASVIACTLFCDPTDAKLRLVPRPGEIEAAKLAAQIAVKKWIDEHKAESEEVDLPVYLGNPG